MAENNPNNTEQEVDLISLFEYFKKGLKSIYNGISSLLKFLFNQFILALIAIKKFWYIPAATAVLGAILFTVVYHQLPKTYFYEMVLQPNYSSNQALYNQVANLKEAIDKNQKINTKGLEAVVDIKIKPFDNLEDETKLYYDYLKYSGGNTSSGEDESLQRMKDSVYLYTVPFKDFGENMEKVMYPTQVITIQSSKPISNWGQAQNEFLKTIEKNPYFQSLLTATITSYKEEIKELDRNLEHIDTLIKKYASAATPSNATIEFGANNQSKNVETELVREATSIAQKKSSLIQRLPQKSNVVSVISPFQQINNKNSIIKSKDLKTGLLYGFIGGLFIILGIKIWHFLNRYEQKLKGK